MRLRKNPLAMVGRIERCWLFAYRAPAELVRRLVPEPLLPIEKGPWGFFNLVVCEIERMRPAGVPRLLGVSYRHAAYRIPVRSPRGRVEGLYFLRSDCDSAPVAHLGRLLTDFGFHRARIDVAETPDRVEIGIDSRDAPASVVIERREPPALAPGSPFASLDEAASFLDYRPFGISIEGGRRLNVVAIDRDESARRPRCVRVLHARWKFLEDRETDLEVCWEVEPIDYRWNRGVLVDG